MKILISLITCILYGINISIACSCSNLKSISKKDVEGVKVAFVGKVLSIEPIDRYSRRITFQILENLKGAADSTEIKIWTGLGGADCGLSIENGQNWYVFANDYEGKAWAGMCGRTSLLSEHTIPPNPYKKKYYRQAVRRYEWNKRRANQEIHYIKKITTANKA